MKWLLSLLLVLVTSGVQGQVIAKVTEGEAARPLPKYVQALDEEGYAAWAEWQNELAKSASDEAMRYQSPYLAGLRTVTSTSGVHTGSASAYMNRRAGSRASQSYGRLSGSSESITMPVRVRNPDFRSTPLRIYNPYCRAKSAPTTLAPDWDNLYCVLNGKVMSVTAVRRTLPIPMNPEVLYKQLMEPFGPSTFERYPLGGLK